MKVVEVAGLIVEVIMVRHMDLFRTGQISLEKKLERERKRMQRYCISGEGEGR